MSSSKEEQQLSELIMQTLEASGSLASVKAMIRQQVFNVINDEQPIPPNPKDKDKDKKKYQLSSNPKQPAQESKLHMSNKAVQNALKNEEEKFALMLVKELLEYYKMEYTLNIFTSESNLQDDPDRGSLAAKTKTSKAEKKPILVQVVQNAISGKGGSTDTSSYAAPKSSVKPKEEPQQPKSKNEPQKKEVSTNKYSVTKYDNVKNSNNYYDNNEIDESIGGFDQISDEEDDYKPQSKQNKGKNTTATNNQRKNPMFSSMEDTIGASMSHGQDMSVDSIQLEQEYDLHEDIISKKR